MALLEFTSKGIWCRQADVYIDPWRKVKRALITHGHSDHARTGHDHYLCTTATGPILRHRLGNIRLETVGFGDSVEIGGVRFSFHPAGHIPGSAQIRAESKGEVWVASGDYKTVDDGFSEAFEPVCCHTFITESTFGLPVYRWRPQAEVIEEMNQWWRTVASEGKIAVMNAYSLGKAQRIIAHIDSGIGPIYCHSAVADMNRVLEHAGFRLPETHLLKADQKERLPAGCLVIAPPAAAGSKWMKRSGIADFASASGWMQLRGMRRRRSFDRGFVLSDHADWQGLNAAVKATGAETVYVTHGYTELYARWLREEGYDARTVNTAFGEENENADQ